MMKNTSSTDVNAERNYDMSVTDVWPPKFLSIGDESKFIRHDGQASIGMIPDQLEYTPNSEPYPTGKPYVYPEISEKPYEPYLSEYSSSNTCILNNNNDSNSLGETVAIPSSLSIENVGGRLKEAGYPYADQHSKNYVATGAGCDVPPVINNEEGWIKSKSIPEERYQPVPQNQKLDRYYDFPMINEKRPRPINVPAINISRYAKYTRIEHDYDDICAKFEGKIFDLAKEKGRPVPPSEGLGYTTTHPNCKCYWEPVDEPKKIDSLAVNEKDHVNHIRRSIGQKARYGSLHTVWQDGHLSKRTRKTNPLKEIRETIQELSNEFKWMNPEYIGKIKKLKDNVGGMFLLVRAAAETLTDHRSEGLEPYRRKLAADEIMQFGRTGIGKNSDINHLTSETGDEFYKTNGRVLDAEFDPNRRELQFLHYEQDPEIIEYLKRGDIQEVSINAGRPRTMDIESCDAPEGKCMVPRGLILGELDGIAFTYVVSNPQGIIYKGRHIPKAKAGVSTTAIEIL